MLQILTKISKFCSVLKQEKKVDFSILSNLESQVAHLRAYETSMFLALLVNPFRPTLSFFNALPEITEIKWNS